MQILLKISEIFASTHREKLKIWITIQKLIFESHFFALCVNGPVSWNVEYSWTWMRVRNEILQIYQYFPVSVNLL